MTAGGDEPIGIGPDRDVRREELRPGVVVRRYTEPLADRPAVHVPLPCHEAQGLVIALSWAGLTTGICRVCSTAYDVDVFDENDGGHGALLTVFDPSRWVLSSGRRSRPLPNESA